MEDWLLIIGAVCCLLPLAIILVTFGLFALDWVSGLVFNLPDGEGLDDEEE